MKDFELLPCPFCGGKAIAEQFQEKGRELKAHIVCKMCRAQTAPMPSMHLAIMEWNLRPENAKTNILDFPKTIQIKYFTDEIDKIQKIDKGDWIDLRAAETVELKAGEFKLIALGVGMKFPKEYEAHIIPRSSTFKNFGIIQTNHCSIIDGSYCGDNDQWYFPAYAIRDTIIHKNDRICQFRIVENQPEIVFKEVENLDSIDRGGIGSTGIE